MSKRICFAWKVHFFGECSYRIIVVIEVTYGALQHVLPNCSQNVLVRSILKALGLSLPIPVFEFCVL